MLLSWGKEKMIDGGGKVHMAEGVNSFVEASPLLCRGCARLGGNGGLPIPAALPLLCLEPERGRVWARCCTCCG